jgi:D-sedoheptulose 7-phosphate isomerase
MSEQKAFAGRLIMSVHNKNAVSARGASDSPASAYLQRLSGLIPNLPFATIDGIVGIILQACEENRTVFVFGNGGSAASASHMMVDMNKNTGETPEGKRLKVIALTDNVPLLTAWANDAAYEHVFSEQLKNFVQRGDVVFAISCSGNSANVVLALETARARGAVTVGIAGFEGGRMKPLCDLCAVVPSDNMQLIEDMHHAILHSVFTAVREGMHSDDAQSKAIAVGEAQK